MAIREESGCVGEMTLVNQTISHYKVISQLGAGGMGEVYLAQDTTLDRKIALKVLPADVASNRDRMERFVREAKAAAALNHPHIAHIPGRRDGKQLALSRGVGRGHRQDED